MTMYILETIAAVLSLIYYVLSKNSEWLIFCGILLLIMMIERLLQELHEDFTDDEWNRTDECLPPEPQTDNDCKEYIVLIKGMKYPTALEYRGGGIWTEDGTGITHFVSHWKDMPEMTEDMMDER